MEKKGQEVGNDWVKMGMIGKNGGQDGKKWEEREINGKPMGQRPGAARRRQKCGESQR
jgi:hypothetical protein